MADKESGFAKLWFELREYFDLKVEYTKLTVAEKVSILFATFVTIMVCFVFGVVILFFLTIAAANWIGDAIGLPLAYSIMVGFYILLLVLALTFKRQLIFNPISRIISKLILK